MPRARDRLRRLGCLALPALLLGCSDGATRIAYDLEAAAAALQRSGESRSVLRHVPEATPGGCAAAYSVQFTANAGLVIWCKDAPGGTATSSHITTYHLRYVNVPRTFNLDKAAGEALVIELAKQGASVVVTAVR